MLQEIKLEDALKKFLQGKKVLVMYDESLKNDGTEFIVEALEKMLERNRYLVDVPAIEDFEFKQEVEQMVKTEKSSTKAVKKKLVVCNCKGIRRCSVNGYSLDGETWN